MESSLTVVVVPISNAEQIQGLRCRVFGITIEQAHFEKDDDPNTRHFAAYRTSGGTLGGGPVCCASFILNSYEGEPAWQLRGMATDPEFRGQGIGTKLLEESERRLFRLGIRLFWCNAQTPAVPFYEKHGWQVVGEEFDIPIAGPHKKMIRRVPSVVP